MPSGGTGDMCQSFQECLDSLICLAEPDDCNFKGIYHWLNAPIHPVSMAEDIVTTIEFHSGGAVSNRLGQHSQIEISKECDRITYRNSSTGAVIYSAEVLSHTKSALIIDDKQMCPDEPCIYLRRNNNNGWLLEEYSEIMAKYVDCEMTNFASCNCPLGEFGNGCKSKVSIVDLPDDNTCWDVEHVGNGEFVALVHTTNPGVNETSLIRFRSSGEMLWQRILGALPIPIRNRPSNLMFYRGNSIVVVYGPTLNGGEVYYYEVSLDGDILKEERVKYSQEVRWTDTYSIGGNQNSTVMLVKTGSKAELILIDNNGKIVRSQSVDIKWSHPVNVSNMKVTLFNPGSLEFRQMDLGLNQLGAGTFSPTNMEVFPYAQKKTEKINVQSEDGELILTLDPPGTSRFTSRLHEKPVALVLSDQFEELKYLWAPLPDNPSFTGSLRRLESGEIAYWEYDTGDFPILIMFDENGEHKYNACLNYYNKIRDRHLMFSFEPIDAFGGIDGKVYLVGDGWRFSKNIFICSWSEVSLYPIPSCN